MRSPYGEKGIVSPGVAAVSALRPAEEQGSDVPVKEVFRNILRDDRLIGLKQREIARTHLGRDLEADVQQLAEALVVGGRLLVVAQRAGELVRAPEPDLGRRGQLRGIDVDDGGVGRAELFAVGIGLGVDLLGDGEPVAAGLGETDQLFKPGGSGGLEAGRSKTCRSRSAR
jgi:hypothetical protein